MTPEQHKQVLGALWVLKEHNRLHFGDAHNTVMQADAAIAIMEAAPIIQNYPDKDSCRKALTEEELNALHDKLGGRPVVATYNESKRKA